MGIGDALNQGLNDLSGLLNGVLGGSSGNGPQPDAQPNDDPNANNTPTSPEAGPPLEDWGDGSAPPAAAAPPADIAASSPGATGSDIGQQALNTAAAGEAATNTLGGELGQSAFGTPTSSDSQVGDASQAASAQAGLAPPDSSTPWGQNLGTIGVPGVGAFGDGQGVGGFAPSGAQLAANAAEDSPFAFGLPGAGNSPGSMGTGGETPYGISGIASSAEPALSWEGSSPAGEAINTLNGIPADGMQTGNADPASFASEPTQAERDAGLDALRQSMQPSSNTLSPSDLSIGGAAAAGAAAALGGSSAAAPAASAPAAAATVDNTGQPDTGLGFTNPVAPGSSAADLAAQAAALVQANMDAAKAADAQIPNTANTQIPGSAAILQPGQFAGVPADPITQPDFSDRNPYPSPPDTSAIDAINKAAGIDPETGRQYSAPSVPPPSAPSAAELGLLGGAQNEPTAAQDEADMTAANKEAIASGLMNPDGTPGPNAVTSSGSANQALAENPFAGQQVPLPASRPDVPSSEPQAPSAYQDPTQAQRDAGIEALKQAMQPPGSRMEETPSTSPQFIWPPNMAYTPPQYNPQMLAPYEISGDPAEPNMPGSPNIPPTDLQPTPDQLAKDASDRAQKLIDASKAIEQATSPSTQPPLPPDPITKPASTRPSSSSSSSSSSRSGSSSSSRSGSLGSNTRSFSAGSNLGAVSSAGFQWNNRSNSEFGGGAP